MVEIVSGSVVTSNYGNSEVSSGDLTIASLSLEAGDRFYILYHYRNVQNINIAAPAWNGQAAEAVLTPFTNDGLYRVQLYRLVASSTATGSLVALVEGDNAPAQFTFLVSTRFVLRGEVAATPEAQLQSASVLTVAGYTNPSFTFTDVVAGDLVVSLIATTAFDGDFNVESSTWSPSNLTQQSTVTNTTSNYSKIQQFGTATTSSTVGWTPSAGEPGWSHIGFVVKAGGDSPAIVNVNGSDPIVSGGDITAVTSTLVATGMTVGGLSVDDFTAVDGDNYTATMPWFTDGGEYPEFGTVTVVMTDGVNSPELSKTLALPATWTSIEVASLSADEDSLSGHPDSPLTIEIGGAIVYPNESITFYDDTTFSDAPTGSVTAWYRSPENIMTEITIINGEIASVGGITLRSITARGITMRNITMRSL